MNKHFALLMITSFLVISLNGCNAENNSYTNSEILNSTIDLPPTESGNQSSSSTQSTSEKGKYKDVFNGVGRGIPVTDENRWAIDDFMANAQKNGVTNPDGSEIIPSDIVTMTGDDNNIYGVTFDYGFISYEYRHSTEMPELNSADKVEEYKSAIAPTEMLKVKAGDVLDNGLKVKNADYSQDSLPDINKDEYKCAFQAIELEGELTLNGYLEYISDDYSGQKLEWVYLWVDDDNCKFPGLTPLPSCEYNEEKGVGVVSNSERIYLKDFPMDKLPSELKEKGMIKVKATIKDPRIGSRVYSPTNFSAELASYEIIKV